MTVEDRIRALDIDLDDTPAPQGLYLPARRSGDEIVTSGMGARRGGVRHFTGRVGDDVSVEEARESARLAAVNCLLAARSVVDDWNDLKGVIQLLGYVRSAPGFGEQHLVLNGASELIVDVFGEAGGHARTAVGVAELPFGLSVELQATFWS